MGGHFVTGHVDGVGRVSERYSEGESVLLKVKLPEEFRNFFWRKGYMALNGVSLTVNKVEGTNVNLCLIPKTLEKTNLSDLKSGDRINFEVDYFARFFVNGFEYFREEMKKPE